MSSEMLSSFIALVLFEIIFPCTRIQDGGLDELLGCYHESFLKTAKLLGHEGELPTLDELK